LVSILEKRSTQAIGEDCFDRRHAGDIPAQNMPLQSRRDIGADTMSLGKPCRQT